MTTEITIDVQLEPCKLVKNKLKEYIMEKIEENTLCSEKYGHILSINKITNIVSDNPHVFRVTFEAETLRVKEGGEYPAIVTNIVRNNIYADIEEVQKILVKKPEKEISIGDSIQVKITRVLFEENNFFCIGKIIDEE